MKSEKLIAAIAIGAITALILIPKTRRMLAGAWFSISDSLKNLTDDASELAEKGSNQLSRFADTAKDVASTVEATKKTGN